MRIDFTNGRLVSDMQVYQCTIRLSQCKMLLLLSEGGHRVVSRLYIVFTHERSLKAYVDHSGMPENFAID